MAAKVRKNVRMCKYADVRIRVRNGFFTKGCWMCEYANVQMKKSFAHLHIRNSHIYLQYLLIISSITLFF